MAYTFSTGPNSPGYIHAGKSNNDLRIQSITGIRDQNIGESEGHSPGADRKTALAGETFVRHLCDNETDFR